MAATLIASTAARATLAAHALLAAAMLAPTAARGSATTAQCIDANENAQVVRRAGRLLAAREKLRACVVASCPAPVRADCATRLEELETALPTVVVEAADASGNSLADVRVMIDDAQPIDLPSPATIELDPGEHHFVFLRGTGAAQVKLTIVVREGEKRRRVAAAFPASGPSVHAENRPTEAAGLVLFGRSVPTLALGLGGVGVVGVTIGIATGVVAGAKHSTLLGECDASGGCPSAAQGDLDSFRSMRTVSTVGYIVGLAGLLSGVVLWLTAPTAPSSGTSARGFVAPTGTGIGGAF